MLLSFFKTYLGMVWNLGTPKNISYLWGFGSFLGIVMVLQVASGFFLSWYFVSGALGWQSVVEITREVSGGAFLRLVHGNTASFVFLIMFVHFFRGLSQSSFFLKGPWLSGWAIMLLTMASAFLGYVLPWGQMSFWGATVIINLLSILPMGKSLVVWLWGGFYVSFFTSSFFFALHFILPFLVLMLAGVHLLLLHFSGSSLPSGGSRSNALKIKFSHLFLFKDLVNLSLLWLLWLWALAYPDWSADPVNFIYSDLSNSPLHIQPEWYFLHFYAILRSIPNKVGGLIAFGMAFASLLALSLVQGKQSLSQFSGYSLLFWSFFFVNFLLMWLGMQAVEDPFIGMGQIMSVLYFIYILVVLSWNWSEVKYFFW